MPKTKEQKRMEAEIRDLKSKMSNLEEKMRYHQPEGNIYEYTRSVKGRLVAENLAREAMDEFLAKYQRAGLDDYCYQPHGLTYPEQ